MSSLVKPWVKDKFKVNRDSEPHHKHVCDMQAMIETGSSKQGQSITHERKYTLQPTAITTTANLAEAPLFCRVLAGTGLPAHEQATSD